MAQAPATDPAFFGVTGVARATGVTPEAVRQWEAAGRIPRAIRTDAGNRLWTADVVEEIKASRAARSATQREKASDLAR